MKDEWDAVTLFICQKYQAISGYFIVSSFGNGSLFQIVSPSLPTMVEFWK